MALLRFCFQLILYPVIISNHTPDNYSPTRQLLIFQQLKSHTLHVYNFLLIMYSLWINLLILIGAVYLAESHVKWNNGIWWSFQSQLISPVRRFAFGRYSVQCHSTISIFVFTLQEALPSWVSWKEYFFSRSFQQKYTAISKMTPGYLERRLGEERNSRCLKFVFMPNISFLSYII